MVYKSVFRCKEYEKIPTVLNPQVKSLSCPGPVGRKKYEIHFHLKMKMSYLYKGNLESGAWGSVVVKASRY